MDTTARVVLAIVLVLVNGFFVAAEFAIVKLRLTQAEELATVRGPFGRAVRRVRRHLDAYLSACQLGITLASLALGWIGEPAFAALLAPLLTTLGIATPEVVEGIAFGVAFVLIAFLHIVLGELAPKSMAIRMPVEVALWTAAPLFAFYWLMYPFIWFLNRSAFGLLRLLGIEIAGDTEVAHSSDELRQVLAASHRHGELGGQEAALASRALEFPELTVGDLMRPASGMVVLDAAARAEETRRVMREHRFSRYPVADGGRERLIGLLHVKDLLETEADAAPDLRALMRPLPSARRDDSAGGLFRRFRKNEPHFAVVRDEHGSIVGFVTLDLLLEALVGRIEDEFPRPRPGWRRRPDGSVEGRGWFSVYSLEQLLGRELGVTADSVGGAVMERLDRVPVAGDRVAFPGLMVEVREMRGPRIERIRVVPGKVPADE